MFSGFVISLVVGVGSGFWIFSKFQKSSGGVSAKKSAIGAAIFAAVVTLIGTYILDYVFKKFT